MMIGCCGLAQAPTVSALDGLSQVLLRDKNNDSWIRIKGKYRKRRKANFQPVDFCCKATKLSEGEVGVPKFDPKGDVFWEESNCIRWENASKAKLEGLGSFERRRRRHEQNQIGGNSTKAREDWQKKVPGTSYKGGRAALFQKKNASSQCFRWGLRTMSSSSPLSKLTKGRKCWALPRTNRLPGFPSPPSTRLRDATAEIGLQTGQ